MVNSGGSNKNGKGVFTLNLGATATPTQFVNPVDMEVILAFVGYVPYDVILDGAIPNATPTGSTVFVVNYVSSSVNVSSTTGYTMEVGWYWTSPTMNYWAEIFNSVGQVVFIASYTFSSQASAQWGMTAFLPSLTGYSYGTATFTNANFALSGTIANNAGVNRYISVPQTGGTSVCGFGIATPGEYANIGTSNPSASGSSYSAHAP